MLTKLEELRASQARKAFRHSIDEFAKLYFKKAADRKSVAFEDIHPELLMHIKELHSLAVMWTSSPHRDEPWRDHSEDQQGRYWKSIYRVINVASQKPGPEVDKFSDEKFAIWCDQNANREVALEAKPDWVNKIQKMAELAKAYETAQGSTTS